MADLRIVDAPEIPTENITGEEKLPTGGSGNYSISLDSLADYTKTKKDLADNTSVDGKVNGVRQELNTHVADLLNPHQVTKGQIGLGNVDNTADADKPVSNSTQAAIISAVAPKADKTYVDNQLTLKANKADVYTKQESSDLVNNSISTALTPVNASLDLSKRGIINQYDSSLTYNSGERVILTNGDIVKSTIDGNVTDPNVDMTGWENPSAIQQIFNDKYSKFKQPEVGAVERDLSVRAKDIQYGADYATLQNAVDAQRSATSDITLGIKTYTLASPLNIKGYAYIKGSGFFSDLKFSGAGNGIVYTGTGLQDDHGQRKLSDFQIRGDNTVGGYLGVKTGTTIGYQHTNTGHFSETNGLLLNGHATGLKIENGYTNRNIYNYYRANKVGLHLKNFTSHREESIYARFNDEAGVLLEGTFQNLTIAGGAIEGNHGRGLWVKNLTAESYPKIVLDDVYFESDGDKAAGVPAIDIQEHPRLHVDVRAGSYWNNVLSGITTGIYKWGSSVSFNGTTLNGFHYAKRMRVRDCLDYASYNSDLSPTESIANGLVEPVMMLEYSPNFRVNGLGPIFQVPLAGRPTRKMLVANEATLTYPHVLAKSASTTTTENTSLDYGDGSWTDIGFSASGDYQNNYAQLTNLLDATSEYMSKVFVFLLKPTADCQIGILSTGAAQTHQAYFQLKAGVTYRMCCFANRTAAGDYRMRLFSTNGVANISYLPIYLAKFKTTQEGVNFANMFATGSL